MTSLHCLIGGHNYEYMHKAGPHGHRFYCRKCFRVVQFNNSPRPAKPEPRPKLSDGSLFSDSSELEDSIRCELRKAQHDFGAPANGDTE